MILTRKNGAPIYRFEHFSAYPELAHGIFGRQGGVSHPPYDSLNTSHGVGDSAGNVEANRLRISEVLEIPEFIFVSQVHGTRTIIVRDSHPGLNSDALREADALATHQSGKLLGIQVADCQPVLIFDPVRKVVANIHSGWRGSIANIAGRIIKRITEEFSCNPADLLVGVGPSLGPCCAEFINYRKEIPKNYWSYRDNKDHFNFWALSRDQLMDAGVREGNISLANICTRCNTDAFFSYRAANVTGRFSAAIGVY